MERCSHQNRIMASNFGHHYHLTNEDDVQNLKRYKYWNGGIFQNSLQIQI